MAGEDWHDGPRDQVPVLSQTDRNDRLKVQDPLCDVIRPETEIKVILKSDADKICDRALLVSGSPVDCYPLLELAATVMRTANAAQIDSWVCIFIGYLPFIRWNFGRPLLQRHR